MTKINCLDMFNYVNIVIDNIMLFFQLFLYIQLFYIFNFFIYSTFLYVHIKYI